MISSQDMCRRPTVCFDLCMLHAAHSHCRIASAECEECVEAHNRRFFSMLKHHSSPIRADVTIGQSLRSSVSTAIQYRTTQGRTRVKFSANSAGQQLLITASLGSANVRLSLRQSTRHQPCHITTFPSRDPNAVVPIGTGP